MHAAIKFIPLEAPMLRKFLMILEKCFTHSPKKFPPRKKKNSPEIPENFFPRGKFPEKCPPGIFGGPPGKFPEIPEIPGNPREIPRKKGGLFRVSRLEPRITPLKLGVFFPEKGGSREKFPGFSGKLSPPKFPEISGNVPKFSRNFPGISRGGPGGTFSEVSTSNRGFFSENLAEIWPNLATFPENLCPENSRNLQKFPEIFRKKGHFWGVGAVLGIGFPKWTPPKFRGKKKKVPKKKVSVFFCFSDFLKKNVFF